MAEELLPIQTSEGGDEWDKYKVKPAASEKEDWSQYAVKKKVSTPVLGNTLPSFQNGSNSIPLSQANTDLPLSPVLPQARQEVAQQQQAHANNQPQGLIPVKLVKPAPVASQTFTQTNGSIRKDKSWENLGDFVPQTVLGGLQKDAGQAIGFLGNVLPKGPTPLLTKEAGQSMADFGAKLEGVGNDKQQSVSSLGLPETATGTVVSGATHFAPDLIELALTPELDVAKIGKLSEVLGKYGTKAAQVATGKFPALMATKGLTSGYVDAKANGASDYDATKDALIKSAEEYGNGAIFEGAGKIANKASDIGKKLLEDNGWMADGKIISGAQKAILNSSAQATAFSAVPFVTNAIEGKSTSLKEIKDNAIFGGVLGLFHGSGPKEGDHTAADAAAQNVQERAPLIDLNNFANAGIDVIKQVYDMPENAADLKIKSAVGAEQAFNAETPEEKQQAILQSSIDGKAAGVKTVTDAVLKNKQQVIDAIPDDLPSKPELVDKINEIHKALDPTEQKKTEIGSQISDIDKQIQSASEKVTDPVLQAENEIKLETLTKQREELNNGLKKLIIKQNEQTEPNQEIPAEQPADEAGSVPQVAETVNEASGDNEVKTNEPVNADTEAKAETPIAEKPKEPTLSAVQMEGPNNSERPDVGPPTSDPVRQKAIDAITHGIIGDGERQKGDVSPRFDLGMDTRDQKRAIRDITNGNYDTAPAKKMIDKVSEFEKNGEYPVIEGQGVLAGVGVPSS